MRGRHKPNVFISYRRSDSRGHAGRLFDFLTARLGRDHVFMDIDSIPAGRAFFDVITETIAKTDVLVVLIGRTWLSATDENGQYRIEAPHDYVRREIEAALARGAKVMPVLVDGAEMPPEVVLPESLKPLAAINALSLPERGWVEAAGELLDALQHTRRRSRRGYVQQRSYAPAIAAGIVMVLAIAGAAYAVNHRSHSSKAAATSPALVRTPTTKGKKQTRSHPVTTTANANGGGGISTSSGGQRGGGSGGTVGGSFTGSSNNYDGGTTGTGNTGSGNTGTGSTGTGKTGAGNTGTGTGGTGTGNSGTGNTATGNTGTGSGNTGTGDTGSGNTGSGTTDGGTPPRIQVAVDLTRLNAASPTPVMSVNVRQRPTLSKGPPSNYIPTDCVTQCLTAQDGDSFFAECYVKGLADWPHGSGYFNYVRVWLNGYIVVGTGQDYGYLPEAAFPSIDNIPLCSP